MTTEFVLLLAIGFAAQLVDGTLGMAYGVLSNTALLALGMAPAHASALVHTAEVFTTGASAASHIYHRNVDWRLVRRLGISGVLGALLGVQLSVPDGNLHSAEIEATRANSPKTVSLDDTTRVCRRIPGCKRWRWVGPYGHLNAHRFRSRRSSHRWLGQYHGIRCSSCGCHDVLRGAGSLADRALVTARAGRGSGGAGRWMGGKACKGPADYDRRGGPHCDPIVLAAVARFPTKLKVRSWSTSVSRTLGKSKVARLMTLSTSAVSPSRTRVCSRRSRRASA